MPVYTPCQGEELECHPYYSTIYECGSKPTEYLRGIFTVIGRAKMKDKDELHTRMGSQWKHDIKTNVGALSFSTLKSCIQ